MPESLLCPNCKHQIEITEALSSQLREQLRKQFEADLRRKEEEFGLKEAAILQRAEELATREASFDVEVQRKLKEAEVKLGIEATAKAKQAVQTEVSDLAAQLEEAKKKAKESQAAELAVRKSKRELETQKEELELQVARTLDQERETIRNAAKKEAADELALKEADKDKLISDLRGQIGELQRKSEQGSQQSQGEVLELELEGLLTRLFPSDSIVPVPKGVHGGDVVHTVLDHSGRQCGGILWETKRTKNWSDTWLSKARDDQRTAKAQIVILVSVELPKGTTTFANIDGVWVTSRSCAIGLASALRVGLIEVARAQTSQEGRQEKMEVLYAYLSGSEFRHRVEGIVEAFVTLQSELEAEKRSTQRMWAKREKQLERAVSQTAGMYGDLQGIIGKSLPAIQDLDVPTLECVESADILTDGEK